MPTIRITGKHITTANQFEITSSNLALFAGSGGSQLELHGILENTAAFDRIVVTDANDRIFYTSDLLLNTLSASVITSSNVWIDESLFVGGGITGSISGSTATFVFGNLTELTASNISASSIIVNDLSASFMTASNLKILEKIVVDDSINATRITGSDAVITSISSSYLDFSPIIDSNAPAYKSGRMYYDVEQGALAFYNEEEDITLQIGQEFYVRVYNDTGATITNGSPVYMSGSATGDKPHIYLAQSEDLTLHVPDFVNHILGVATHDIEDNSVGYVTELGIVRGIDTNAYNVGDLLFVSSSAGELTNVAPVFPYELIEVGTVVRSSNNGFIFVKPREPIGFNKINGMSGSYVAHDGDLWVYQSNGAWTHTNYVPKLTSSVSKIDTELHLGGALYDGTTSVGTNSQVLSSTASGTEWVDITSFSGSVSGSGTTNYLTKWSSANSLTDSSIYDDGSNVMIGSYIGSLNSLSVKSQGSNADEISLEHFGNTVKIASLGQVDNHGSLTLRTNGNTIGVLLRATGSSYIEGNGNSLVIGKSSTSADFEVYSNRSGIDTKIRIDSNSTGNAILEIDRQTSGADSLIRFQDGSVTTWNIGNYASTHLDFLENTDTLRVRFEDGGNVGIGTTSVPQKLTISGSISASGDFYLDGGIYDTNNSLGTVGQVLSSDGTTIDWIDLSELSSSVTGSGTTNYLAKWSSGTSLTSSVVYEDSNGNIGLGVADPSEAFEIKRDFAALPQTVIKLAVGGSNTVGGGAAIYFDTSTSASPNDWHSRIAARRTPSDNGSSDLAFYTTNASSGPIEHVTLTQVGNLGIGTTVAPQRLTITGSISASGDLYLDGGIYDTNNSLGTSNQILSSNGTSIDWIDLSELSSSVTGSGTTNYLTKWSSGTSLTSSVVYEDSGGNIGIGTTTIDSDTALHLYGERYLTIENNIEASIKLIADGGTAAYIGHSGWSLGAGNVGIGDGSSPTIVIDNGNDRVGVGTLTPTEALTVEGNISASGTGFFDDIEATNSITASTVLVNNKLTIDGDLLVTGQTVMFSASYVNITSSNVSIGDNIITLNAYSPFQQYAGIEMHDSGSAAVVQFLWDSMSNHFFVSGSTATNSRNQIVLGPEDNANLGVGYLPVAYASNELSSSILYQTGTNVGLGNSTPRSALHVGLDLTNGATYAPTGLTIKQTAAGNTNGIYLERSGENKGYYISISSTGNDGLTFSRQFSGTISEVMTLTREGNVGVGTTAPGALFTVAGNISASGDFYLDGGIYDTNNSLGTSNQILSSNGSTLDWIDLSELSSSVTGSGTANYLAKWSSGTSLTSSALYETPAGLFGIGTTVPLELLTLNSETGDARITLDAASGFDPEIKFYEAGTVKRTIGYDAGSSQFRIGTDNVDTSVDFVINSVGNVGIGTTSPDEHLVVYESLTGPVGTVEMTKFKQLYTLNATATDYVKGMEIQRNSMDIPAGVVANGYQIGLAVQGYISDVEFGGTVTNQYGIWSRVGVNVASGSGERTVTRAIGIFLENLDGAGTITDSYGVYQQSTNAKNYFAGNIGIGTTIPNQELTVAGSISASADVYIDGGIYDTNDVLGTSGQFLKSTGTNILWDDIPLSGAYTGSFSGSNATFTTVTSATGSFNIIVSNVVSGSDFYIYNLYDSTQSSGSTQQVLISTDDGVEWYNLGNITSSVTGSGTANYLAKWTSSKNLTSSVVYEDSGNIGIGTTTMDHNLVIENDTNGTAEILALRSSDATWASNQQIEVNFQQLTTSIGRVAGEYFGSNIFGVSIHGYDGGLVKTLSVAGGCVGIGSTSPGCTLDVVGNVCATSFTGSFSGSLDLAGFSTGSVLFAGATGVISEDNSNFYWDEANNRLGIGTTSPLTLLHTTGDIYMAPSASIASDLIIRNAGSNGATDQSEVIFRGNGGTSTDRDTAIIGTTDILTFGRGDLFFSTKGTSDSARATERMRIDTSGDMYMKGGRIYVNESDDNTRLAVALTRDANEGFVDVYADGSIVNRIRGDGASYFTGGNVGIGTTSPQGRFEVYDGGSSSTVLLKVTQDDQNPVGITIGNDTFSTTEYEGLTLHVDNSGVASVDARGTGSELAFGVGSSGTEAVRIDSTGNVGIGTTSPSSSLHVNGTDINTRFWAGPAGGGIDCGIQIRGGRNGTLGGVTSYINFDNYDDNASPVGEHNMARIYASMESSQGRDGSLSLQSYNGSSYVDGLHISSSGNIGIGTTAPAGALHVESSNGGWSYFSTNSALDVPADESGPILGWNYSNGNGESLIVFNTDGGGGGTAERFSIAQWSGASLTEHFTVDTNGDIGIGTTDGSHFSSGAATAVSIVASGTDASAHVNIVSTGTDNATLWFGGGTTSGTDDSIARGGIAGVDGSHLAFYTNPTDNSTGMAEVMRVQSDGNLGIGTTSPGRKFHLNESSYTTVAQFESGQTAAYISIKASGHSTYGGLIGSDRANSISVKFGDDSANWLMAIHESGNVGIGTLIPGCKLDVNGNVCATSFTGSLSGSVNLGGFSTGSVLFAGATGDISEDNSNFYWDDSNNRLGIGTNDPIYELEVNGEFAATTKHFIIRDQDDPSKRLVHGSLEGPENGVYHRGKSTSNVIELPKYWKWLVDVDTITVSLTAVNQTQTLSVTDVKDNKIYVKNGIIDRILRRKLNYHYIIFGERKDTNKLRLYV
jgi:hypothetical protein